MSSNDSRIAAYLDRLGLERRPPPDLATLELLHVRHLERVPFENLDIHLGIPIRLDVDAILTKILGSRGGFCYELNGAFAWLLRELGYDVTLLEACVAGDDGQFGMRFGHLALRVDLDRPILVDVGFGDCFVEPFPFDAQASVQRGREYRLRPTDGGPVLECRKPEGEWSPEYLLSSAPRLLADFEAACRHHETAPASHFRRGPICTRVDGDARITLHRDRLTRGDHELAVTSRAQWSRLLAEHFGIRLPEGGPAGEAGGAPVSPE